MRLLFTICKMTTKSFNPRTRKGCDKSSNNPTPAAQGFNPRTRKGCDKSIADYRPENGVSTHAPVKDATLFTLVFPLQNKGFNPRTRKGCD